MLAAERVEHWRKCAHEAESDEDRRYHGNADERRIGTAPREEESAPRCEEDERGRRESPETSPTRSLSVNASEAEALAAVRIESTPSAKQAIPAARTTAAAGPDGRRSSPTAPATGRDDADVAGASSSSRGAIAVSLSADRRDTGDE